jgi:hypothetical protein
MTTYYTIADFSKFNSKYILPDEVTQSIKMLASSIVTTEDTSVTVNKNIKPKQNKVIEHRSRDTDDWSAVRSYKVTKIEVKEGTEKTIKDIRIALNKFSNKNADVQQQTIIQLINKVLEDSENKEDDAKKVMNMIFDVVSSNEFYSTLYAKLYKDLINVFPMFADKLTDIIENYKNSFNSIKLVDPNVDYDGYCTYVKSNDLRRAMTMFIVNLTKIKVLPETEMLDIILYLENLVIKSAEETDKSVLIEETTENIYIAITENKSTLNSHLIWSDQIVPNIHTISKLRKADPVKYVSMSNRAVFKYMDILDDIKK